MNQIIKGLFGIVLFFLFFGMGTIVRAVWWSKRPMNKLLKWIVYIVLTLGTLWVAFLAITQKSEWRPMLVLVFLSILPADWIIWKLIQEENSRFKNK